MSRKPIIAGNWKMNLTPSKAREFVSNIKLDIDTDNVDVVLCPPFVDLAVVKELISGTNISLGAQNVYYEEKGAFTGEISAEMLFDIGCKYVIIGHSERREYFNETNEIVNKKIKRVLESKMLPIMCCGENLSQRENMQTLDFINSQIIEGLKDISADDVKKMIIAYEPIWAIGTGKTATSSQAEEVCKSIRECIKDLYDEDTANKVRIQYGGSVNSSNAKELFDMEDIDGGLVGGASLKEEFSKIVNC